MWGAFAHDSNDYMAAVDPEFVAGVGATTYRPLPMASLALGQALGGAMAVHHAISLLIHWVACLLLVAVGRRAGLGRGAWVVAAALALHPALGEAWIWVNGRSDAMAGVCLVGLALALQGEGRLAKAGVFVATALGLLCKITFGPAASALILAACLRDGRWVRFAPHAAGAVAALGLRGVVLGGSPSSGVELLGPALLERLPRVLAMAGHTLAVPAARPMRCLAWELATPWGAAAVFGAVLVVGLAVALVVRRSWWGLALLGGAVGAIAPTSLVGDVFWLGFDRYLYLPGVLLALGVIGGLRGGTGAAPRALAVVLAAVLGLCALGSWLTSTFYGSQNDFVYSIVEQRPDDAAGWLLLALSLGQAGAIDDGVAALTRVPQELPVPLAHLRARARLTLGDVDGAVADVEATLAAHPDSRSARMLALAMRVRQGRWDAALPLARQTVADPASCPVLGVLLADVDGAPPALRELAAEGCP